METYGTIMISKLSKREITWQQAFDWLQSHGMTAKFAKNLLKGYEHV